MIGFTERSEPLPMAQSIILAAVIALAVTLAVIITGALVNLIERTCMNVISALIGNRTAEFLCEKLTFPGVMLHELAHAAVIAVLGGKITHMRLLESGKDGRLGHVTFEPRGPKAMRMLQMSLGSCAPVIFGAGWICLIIHVLLLFNLPVWATCLMWYLMISIAFHMSMSREDIKNYLKGSPIVFLMAFVAGIFFIGLK